MSDNLNGIQSHSTNAFWNSYLLYELAGDKDEIDDMCDALKDADVSCDVMQLTIKGVKSTGIMVVQSASGMLEDVIIRSDMHVTELYVIDTPDIRGRRMFKRQAGLPLGMIHNIGTTGDASGLDWLIVSRNTEERFTIIPPAVKYTGCVSGRWSSKGGIRAYESVGAV